MKKTSIIALLFLMALSLGGCYQSDDGSYVAPITIYEKIAGKWGVDKLTLVDEHARANAISPDNFEITSWFNFQEFTIQFNVDGSNMPTTFEVAGDVPELFLTSGNWDLDSAYPNTNLTAVKINLYADASKSQVVDQLSLTSIPGAQEMMEFQLIRISNKVAFASYVFNLSPAN